MEYDEYEKGIKDQKYNDCKNKMDLQDVDLSDMDKKL